MRQCPQHLETTRAPDGLGPLHSCFLSGRLLDTPQPPTTATPCEVSRTCPQGHSAGLLPAALATEGVRVCSDGRVFGAPGAAHLFLLTWSSQTCVCLDTIIKNTCQALLSSLATPTSVCFGLCQTVLRGSGKWCKKSGGWFPWDTSCLMPPQKNLQNCAQRLRI